MTAMYIQQEYFVMLPFQDLPTFLRVENQAAMVQVMAWHQNGAKPLSEQMLTKLTGEFMCH